MLFWAIWFLSWPSKFSKGTIYRRACWGILPCLTRATSSGAQNAEHSKSTAIIIRAILLWTLMAVPVLLPRHIQRAHLRLKGVNTWFSSTAWIHCSCSRLKEDAERGNLCSEEPARVCYWWRPLSNTLKSSKEANWRVCPRLSSFKGWKRWHCFLVSILRGGGVRRRDKQWWQC